MFDISTSRDFYAKLKADFDDLMKQPDSARLALNCIITAYHLHEWVWGDWLKTDHAIWRKLNIRDKESFLQWLYRAFPYFGYVEALANGSKHFSRNQGFATKRVLRDADGPFLVGMPYLLIDFGESAGSLRWMAATHLIHAVVGFWDDFFARFHPDGTTIAASGGAQSQATQAAPQKDRSAIQVYRVAISKDQLRTLSAEERALVLLLGHALNQIGVFVKLVRFSSNKDPLEPTEQLVSAGQTQVIVRILYGVLFEIWQVITRRANHKIIGLTYLPLMDEAGQNAFAEMKKHFGQSNLLHKLRNNFAFHYPRGEDVEAAFNAVPDDDPWEWYLSGANTNSFYFSCDLVISFGIVNATGEPDVASAYYKVMDEVMHVANLMPQFAMHLMKAILTKRLGPAILTPEPLTIIRDAPTLEDFWLPFYADNQYHP